MDGITLIYRRPCTSGRLLYSVNCTESAKLATRSKMGMRCDDADECEIANDVSCEQSYDVKFPPSADSQFECFRSIFNLFSWTHYREHTNVFPIVSMQ